MSAMGRPKKLKDKRRLYSIYVDEATMTAVDEFVHQRKQEDKAYSRSDFFNEAAEAYLEKRKRGTRK